MARFLGWKRNEKPGDLPVLAQLPEFASILPTGTGGETPVINTEIKTPRPGDPSHTIAKWSDGGSFGTSDGFNLAKWRAECEAELEAASVRRKWMKPAAKPGRLSPLAPPGEDQFSVNFVQAHQHLENVRRKQYAAEFGKEHRKLAAQRRQEKDKTAKPVDQETQEASGVIVKATTVEEQQADEERQRRAGKVFARIKSGNGGSQRALRHVMQECHVVKSLEYHDDQVSTDADRAARTEGNIQASLKQAKENKRVKEENKVVRDRIKNAVTVRLTGKVKLAKKVLRKREKWKALVANMAEKDRNIAQEAFDMYAQPSIDGKGMHANHLWKALAYIGLRGSTGRERIAVERVCQSCAISIWKQYTRFEQNMGVQEEEEDDARIDEVLFIRSKPKSGMNADDDSATSLPTTGYFEHLLDFEEFVAVVVCSARKELSNQRQEMHFGEFQAVLRENARESVFLGIWEFRRLALRLGIDYLQVDRAVKSLRQPSKVPQEKALNVRQTSRQNKGRKSDVSLDFSAVHEILLAMEETHHHRVHKRELEIKAKHDLGDDLFWTFEGELARLFDTFVIHDANKWEYLDFNDTKHYLHHLGFQPHRPREAEAIDMLLHQSDADGSETISFNEMLDLIMKIRQHQRSVREAKLRHEFGYYVKMDHLKDMPRGSAKPDQAAGDAAPAAASTDPCIPVQKLHDLVASCGLSGKNLVERELVEFTINASCEGEIRFPVFEELCQQIVETLLREEVAEQYAEAETLEIPNKELHRYQQAFDHARRQDVPAIHLREIPKVLTQLLTAVPSKDELAIIIENLAKSIGTHEVTFSHFLHFMCSLLAPGSARLCKDQPFTLQQVPEKKLRQILRLFPVSTEYAEEVRRGELPDVVASFLGVTSKTNLREHNIPISNTRQLIAYAQKRAPVKQVEQRGAVGTQDLLQSMQNAMDHMVFQGAHAS